MIYYARPEAPHQPTSQAALASSLLPRVPCSSASCSLAVAWAHRALDIAHRGSRWSAPGVQKTAMMMIVQWWRQRWWWWWCWEIMIMFSYAGNIKRPNCNRTRKTPMVMGSEIFATIVLPFPMFSNRWVEVSVFNLTFINVLIWGHVLSTVSQITKSLNRFHCHLWFVKGCLNFLAQRFFNWSP